MILISGQCFLNGSYVSERFGSGSVWLHFTLLPAVIIDVTEDTFAYFAVFMFFFLLAKYDL